MKAKPIRVFVVDDHPAVRVAIAAKVDDEADLQLCGEAASAEEAMPMIAREKPDVAVIDLSLKDVHGLDLVGNLRVQHPQLSMIVYSMYDEQMFAERALRAGASGYVMKSEPMHRVIEAVRDVVSGRICVSSEVATRLLGKLTARQGNAAGNFENLTDREMEVLQMMGDGASMREISDRLHVSYKTVETYRRRAKKKLGLKSVSELLQYAIRWRDRHTGGNA